MTILTPHDIALLRIEADKGPYEIGAQLHVLLDAYEDAQAVREEYGLSDTRSLLAEVEDLISDTAAAAIEDLTP